VSSTTAPTSRTVIETYVDALQRGDGDAIRASFATDAEWTLTGELPLSGTWRGADVIIDAFLARALASFAPGSISFEVTELLADGDRAAMEWITRGGSPSGEPYENRYLALFTITEGQIASVREYVASAGAAHALFSA
jgi:ketosteroid isomerase-like protein